MSELDKRLQMVYEKIKSKEIISRKGLGNEIPYYIFDYDPHDELKIRDFVKLIMKNFSYIGSEINPVEIDLYEVFLEILKEKNIFDVIEEYEKNMGKDKMFRALESVSKPENFINIITKQVEGHNLILITGVGKVWPFMRAHIILNNLKNHIDKTATILFFPGTFSGTSVKLFSIFEDKNYYRGFKIS
ncbi:uncharacterized protein DUF1788 [Thermohydrogenium kirishiense]|uniref:DUF1788 domain-containing protein n=1 Tax=Thermoanaerobacterium thermosaccharolyticum TaxID=1517 RepID=UPI0010512A2F|nr:uncharacterized protein DUF1788 [Thermohydrogenium kirishiense]